MEVTLKDIQAEAKAGLAVLDQWEAVEIPESIEAALESDWLRTTQAVGEGFLGTLSEEDQKLWRKRAMSAKNANRILREFEEFVVRGYVRQPDSPLVLALSRMTAGARLVAEHASDIWETVLPFLAIAGNQAAQVFNDSFNAKLGGTLARWGLLNDDGWDQLLVIEERLRAEQAELERLIQSAVAALASFTLERLFGIVASTSAIRESVVPVTTSRDFALSAAAGQAFPQGKGRVRRRKRSRG